MTAADTPMAGKTCVITGATSGIGLAAAQALGALGAQVAIVGRDPERSAAAAQEVRDRSGNEHIAFHVADLSSMGQVRRLAGELQYRHPRIDVLVNNAGAYFMKRRETAEGLEMTFALNVLAPFLLTNLLHDRLVSSAPARIVNVASSAHLGTTLPLDDLQARRKYAGFRTYGQSKLALILLTHEFARRFEGTRVTANSLHPGFVASRFGSNNGRAVGVTIRVLATLFGVTSTQGADTIAYLASSPEVGSVSGRYFYRREEVRSSAISYDDDLAGRLWTACEELTASTGGPVSNPTRRA
jgi:retinol dehydrogenase 12